MARARDPWVVLPVRGESAGKSRLAPVLGSIERMRLNRRLLGRALAVIERWQGTAARCIVVSACERSLQTARRQGARVQVEPMPRRGLNRAAALGVQRARRCGARHVVVLPGDLACISAASLRRFASKARSNRAAVIAPDDAGSGTNVLLLPARAPFAFAYGPESFARHLQALTHRGWDVTVCADPALRFDLDTPQDLTVMASRRDQRRGWRMV